MESSGDTTAATTIGSSSSSPPHHYSSLSPSPSSSPPPNPPSHHHVSSVTNNTNTNSNVVVVVSPCAACKILRRRCTERCVLAPYFPPTDPLKFTTAHRVFGASNIIKFLQELPECQRADAVSSMVYEANARLRDPVYGCAGAICQLQKQVSELQAQLAKAQAEVVNVQCQQANLAALICMEMSHDHQQSPQASPQQQFSFVDNFIMTNPQSYPSFVDENCLGSTWEPLWT